MEFCRHCEHKLHWDDAECPQCRRPHGHIDAEGLQRESKNILFRLAPYVLGGLIVVVMAVTNLGAGWAAALVLGVIGGIAFLVYRIRRKRRTRERLDEMTVQE